MKNLLLTLLILLSCSVFVTAESTDSTTESLIELTQVKGRVDSMVYILSSELAGDDHGLRFTISDFYQKNINYTDIRNAIFQNLKSKMSREKIQRMYDYMITGVGGQSEEVDQNYLATRNEFNYIVNESIAISIHSLQNKEELNLEISKYKAARAALLDVEKSNK